MAEEEHLAILKQGVEAWNSWEEKSDVMPDLYGADLRSVNLEGINLSYANLVGANLEGANLSCGHLEFSNLSNANLSHANLSGAGLLNADFNKANLYRANFNRADLRNASFNEADLRNANLCGADLYGATLHGANLLKTLYNIHTRFPAFPKQLVTIVTSMIKIGPKSDLSHANLSGADLSRADLNNANLHGANFSNSRLDGADLRAIQATFTNFSGATLTGACIQDWNISYHTNLQNVVCEYIFVGYDDENAKFTNRRPHDPNKTFAPGEFAALVQKSLDTVDLIFIDGIDWKAFFQSFQQLQEKYRNNDLGIQAIEKKPDGAFVIRLEVAPEADKVAIEQDSKALYEIQLRALEAQYQEMLRLQGDNLEDARRTIENERQEKANLMAILTIMSNNQGPRNDFRGARFGGGVAIDSGTQTGGTLNDFSDDQGDRA